MKLFILLAVIAAVQSTPIEPRVEREDGKTPWSERQYVGWSPSIVRGQPADISAFPHMLALLDLGRGGFICGASNIASTNGGSNNIAISAAHCTDRNAPASQIQLRGGSTNRNTGGVVFQSSSYINHPQYNRNTLANDIVIIRTTTNMVGTNIVAIPISPICNTAGTNACCRVCAPQSVTVTGWGRDENGVLPLNLRQLTAPVHDRASCGWSNIGPDVFCKAVVGGADTCNGDSGGPLIRTGTREQVGIVSFGTSVCGDGSRPSGNVRIEAPQIRNWISSQTGI
jgi:trypsin